MPYCVEYVKLEWYSGIRLSGCSMSVSPMDIAPIYFISLQRVLFVHFYEVYIR